jgi:hypothetical protein
MSLDSRYFDDAALVLDHWERALGPSDESREYRARLAQERGTPAPADFVPLEIPARRPTPREAAPFLGRWAQAGRERGALELEFRASGDTVIAWARERFETGGREFEGPWHLIQVTADGTLEVGAPYLRGIAGLVVFRCRIGADGMMDVTKQVRGFSPRGPTGDLAAPVRFSRLAAAAGGR